MARPTNAWFVAMDKLYVEEKLKSYSFLNEKYKDDYSSFKQFCCFVMSSYGWQPIDQIQKEFDDQTFYNLNFKRMHETNVRRWKEISKKVFKRDNYTCSYCGCVGGLLEVDHVIPFSKGGSDELDNLVCACRKCNRQKRDKTLEEFERWRKQHE